MFVPIVFHFRQRCLWDCSSPLSSSIFLSQPSILSLSFLVPLLLHSLQCTPSHSFPSPSLWLVPSPCKSPLSCYPLNDNTARHNLTRSVYAQYARNQVSSIILPTEAFFGDPQLRPPPPGFVGKITNVSQSTFKYHQQDPAAHQEQVEEAPPKGKEEIRTKRTLR